MHPNPPRRVHSAELKAQVLAQCQQPGASVAAVALAHGLNANLVRKWLVGRGLQRCGLTAPRQPQASVETAQDVQFIPVDLGAARAEDPPQASAAIHVDLRLRGAELSVQWPASQSGACAAWLRELALSLR